MLKKTFIPLALLALMVWPIAPVAEAKTAVICNAGICEVDLPEEQNTVFVPDTARNYRVTLTGAPGGGTGWVTTPGYPGHKIEFTVFTGEEVRIYLGGQGEQGTLSTKSSIGLGGLGGKNLLGGAYNGGAGGNSGKGAYASPGGGGGAASVVLAEGKTFVAAGGGGMGGYPNCNFFTLMKDPRDTGKALYSSTAKGESSTVDSGGGGGGGGGVKAGFGGAILKNVESATYSCKGFPGFPGQTGTSAIGMTEPPNVNWSARPYRSSVKITYEDSNYVPGEVVDSDFDSNHDWTLTASAMKNTYSSEEGAEADFQICLLRDGAYLALNLLILRIEGQDGYEDSKPVSSSENECAISTIYVAGMPPGTYFYKLMLELSDGKVVESKAGKFSITETRASTFNAVVQPSIKGAYKLGSSLTANPGKWLPSGSMSIQWLRNGLAIKGATKSSYRLTSSDMKSQISFQVTIYKQGLITVVQRSTSIGKVSKGTIAGQGVFAVGADLTPGIYRSNGTNSKCIWKRLSSFEGIETSVIGQGGGSGQQLVAISRFDIGFDTRFCGAWTKIS